MNNITTVERGVFEALRLGLVANNYLPDITLSTAGTWDADREAWQTSNPDRPLIDVFGVAAPKARRSAKANAIYINTLDIDPDLTRGHFASVFYDLISGTEGNPDAVYNQSYHPVRPEDVVLEIYYYADSVKVDRILRSTIINSLGSDEKYLVGVDDNGDLLTGEDKDFLLLSSGVVRQTNKNYFERAFRFTATDVFEELAELRRSNIKAFSTAIFTITLDTDTLTDTLTIPAMYLDIPQTGQTTKYVDFDDADQLQKGQYDRTQEETGVVQGLDSNALFPYFTLKNKNTEGNFARFTGPTGRRFDVNKSVAGAYVDGDLLEQDGTPVTGLATYQDARDDMQGADKIVKDHLYGIMYVGFNDSDFTAATNWAARLAELAGSTKGGFTNFLPCDAYKTTNLWYLELSEAIESSLPWSSEMLSIGTATTNAEDSLELYVSPKEQRLNVIAKSNTALDMYGWRYF